MVTLEQLPFGHHNGLREANRRRGFRGRLVGNGATRQSRARLPLVVGVALSSATAATFRNGEPGSGERLRLHYVSLYRSAPRGVHCSYWNQARARVCFSLFFYALAVVFFFPYLLRPAGAFARIRPKRARYAHRRGNRGAARVKSISSPTRRCASARQIASRLPCN